MPITSKYLFVARMDVDANKEALFNEVYNTEHIPHPLRSMYRLYGPTPVCKDNVV